MKVLSLIWLHALSHWVNIEPEKRLYHALFWLSMRLASSFSPLNQGREGGREDERG